MYQKYFKRMFDVIGSLLLMPFVLFVILIFGILIKIEDHGPMFYISVRLGKNGRTFKMFKLRSMKINAPDIRNDDGSTFCSSTDNRLTRWGKFVREKSIDELPQLFNVLIGNMSFIGPRPDLPEHIDCYDSTERRKLLVSPGITGYSQANIRNAAIWKIRLKNDVYYVDNLSLKLDTAIIFATIKLVLGSKNIYSDKQKIIPTLENDEVTNA